MKKSESTRARWFSVADAFLLLLIVGLIVAAAALFLFPPADEEDAETVVVDLELTLESGSEQIMENIAVDDAVFNGDTEIGKVVSTDINSRYVLVSVTLEVDDGNYCLNGQPVMINSAFVLETRTCSVNGTVRYLSVKEDTGA